jgi:hypothetical protein
MESRMTFFHSTVVLILVALLAWGARYVGGPTRPLMPGVTAPSSFIPRSKSVTVEPAIPSPEVERPEGVERPEAVEQPEGAKPLEPAQEPQSVDPAAAPSTGEAWN